MGHNDCPRALICSFVRLRTVYTELYTSISVAYISPHQGGNKSLKLCCVFPLVIIIINFLQLNNLQMSEYQILIGSFICSWITNYCFCSIHVNQERKIKKIYLIMGMFLSFFLSFFLFIFFLSFLSFFLFFFFLKIQKDQIKIFLALLK